MIYLTLPFPPSVNTYYRSPRSGPLAGRTLISKAGRAYRVAVAETVAERGQKMPAGARLSVAVALYAPDRRTRDIDNSMKALLDSLHHAGVFEDDGLIDELHIRRGPVTKGGKAVVVVMEATNVRDAACNAIRGRKK